MFENLNGIPDWIVIVIIACLWITLNFYLFLKQNPQLTNHRFILWKSFSWPFVITQALLAKLMYN